MQLEAAGRGNDPAQHFPVDRADQPKGWFAVHGLDHQPLVQQFLDGRFTRDFADKGPVHRFREGDEVQRLPAVGRDAHELDLDDGGEFQRADTRGTGVEPHPVPLDQVAGTLGFTDQGLEQQRVPAGFLPELTRRAVEDFAAEQRLAKLVPLVQGQRGNIEPLGSAVVPEPQQRLRYARPRDAGGHEFGPSCLDQFGDHLGRGGIEIVGIINQQQSGSRILSWHLRGTPTVPSARPLSR